MTGMLVAILGSVFVPAMADLKVPRCQEEFSQSEKKWNSRGEWKETSPPGSGFRVLRTPTGEFGIWLEAAFSEEALKLSAVSNKETIELDFSNDCNRAVRKLPGLHFPEASFDDLRLKKALDKGTSGIIYVWSPGMARSVEYRERFSEVAKQLGLDFVSVLDPRVPGQDSSKLDSVELYMRQVTNHFPSSLVFRNGKILEGTIIGAMNEFKLKDAIAEKLEEKK